MSPEEVIIYATGELMESGLLGPVWLGVATAPE